MKNTIILSCFAFLCTSAVAQQPEKKPAAVKAAEKINLQSKKLADQSNQVVNESTQVAENAQQVVNNVKAVIKVFEPFIRLRLKKKSVSETPSGGSVGTPAYGNQEQTPPAVLNTDIMTNNAPPFSSYISQTDIDGGIPLIAENSVYNTDGSANLGNQNHPEFGCYVDIMSGAILDEIDAAGNSKSIDLIFTATDYFGSAPMYALLTPSYAKNDPFAYNFFKGARYKDRNIPPAGWTEVNESQIALTSLNGAKFDKIKDNNQLMAVVKQSPGFKDRYESRTSLEGKVFAIKTVMGSRTAYGLLYVLNQYGTTGESGYLKVKLKVSGLDADGDGMPDASLYTH